MNATSYHELLPLHDILWYELMILLVIDVEEFMFSSLSLVVCRNADEMVHET